jgi:hypothetical protein
MDNNFSQVLGEFGSSLGLKGLDLDKDGHCALRFDDLRVHLEMLGSKQQVLLHCCLGAVPANPDAAYYARLLHGNHFFAKTAGATIGVHAESGSIDMAMVLDGERLTLAGFERALEAFVNTSQAWQASLGGAGDAAGAPAAGVDAGSMEPPHIAWSAMRV